jgi:phosphatidate phosphatase APP1
MMKRLLLCVLLLPLVASADGNKAVLYDGYGSGERFAIEGRVIETEKLSQANDSDPWWRNLWRNFRLMKNSEREDVALTVKVGGFEARATTDEEGYFRVTGTPAPPPGQILAPGWHAVTAQGKRAQGQGRLLIVPKANTLGLISDIDDTVMVSEVPDKQKLLENTFMKNPRQRQTFPGTADFYKRLLARNADSKAAPMFYLSASPRQLAGNIESFLAQNNYPQGVLLTRRIGGDGRDPLRDQKQYKIAKIEAILAALPWVKFVLVGDDGELDPETYQAIQDKYPRRVNAIYIRKVSPDPKRAVYPGQRDLVAALGA